LDNLAKVFEWGLMLHSQLDAERRAGRLDSPAFLRSTLSPAAAAAIQQDLQRD